MVTDQQVRLLMSLIEKGLSLTGAAALQGKSLTGYIQELLEGHVQELERKGLLPKGK